MRNVVDVVFLEELGRDDPWATGNDFIHPFAMPHCFCSLGAGENGETFALVRFSVAGHADEEIGIGECGLCLFQLTHVAGWQLAGAREDVSCAKDVKLTQDETNQTPRQRKP